MDLNFFLVFALQEGIQVSTEFHWAVGTITRTTVYISQSILLKCKNVYEENALDDHKPHIYCSRISRFTIYSNFSWTILLSSLGRNKIKYIVVHMQHVFSCFRTEKNTMIWQLQFSSLDRRLHKSFPVCQFHTNVAIVGIKSMPSTLTEPTFTALVYLDIVF